MTSQLIPIVSFGHFPPIYLVSSACLSTAAADEEALLHQLRLQNIHLESSLQIADAQLSVGKLDQQSVQHAYDEAMKQLIRYESTANKLSLRLAAQDADLQVQLLHGCL